MSNLSHDISSICTHMHTRVEGKKHGAWNYYENDKVKLAYDTYYPNMNAYVKRGDQWVEVYSASGNGNVYKFNEGLWVDYVHQLGEKARAIKAEKDEQRKASEDAAHSRNFSPIDDSVVFAR